MLTSDYESGFAAGFEAGYKAGVATNTRPVTTPTWRNQNKCHVCGMIFELGKAYGYVCGASNCPSKVISSVTASTIPDGLSYEEIYGSVVYQQNKNKKE